MIRFNKLLYFILLSYGLCCTVSSVYAQADFNLFSDEPTTESAKEEISESQTKDVSVAQKTDKNKSLGIATKQADGQKNKKNTVKKTFGETLDKINPKPKEDKVRNPDNPNDRETWLESLISKGTSELFQTQEDNIRKQEKKRIEKAMLNRHSNAAHFDISGVKLRMSPEEIEKNLTSRGFRRIIQETSIPNFIKWRCDELCRLHGVVGFERLAVCARSVAVENGFEYISHETYNRYTTRETIDVLYSSTFTNNLAHQIVYKSDLPLFASRASQHVYVNNLKIYDFWRRVDEKYGKPDNTSEVKWGLGGKKPYMKATTGNLELVDPILKNLDISRMMSEDTRLSNVPYYNF